MKKVYKKVDIMKAMKKKGYQETNSSHKKYVFIVDGKKTSINTVLSHSYKEVSGKLLSLIRKQMGFDNKSDFDKYISCTMSEKSYREMLIHSDKISF